MTLHLAPKDLTGKYGMVWHDMVAQVAGGEGRGSGHQGDELVDSVKTNVG
jgi:hypothetical protein